MTVDDTRIAAADRLIVYLVIVIALALILIMLVIASVKRGNVEHAAAARWSYQAAIANREIERLTLERDVLLAGQVTR